MMRSSKTLSKLPENALVRVGIIYFGVQNNPVYLLLKK